MALANLVQYFLKPNPLVSTAGVDVAAPMVEKPLINFGTAAQNMFTKN